MGEQNSFSEQVEPGAAVHLALDHLYAVDPALHRARAVGQGQAVAHGGLVAATVRVGDDGVDVVLEQPLRGVAPGQAAVFYRPDADGDVVLGSATIAATSR